MARRQIMDDRSSLRTAMIEHAEKMIVRGGTSSLTARALAGEMKVAVGTTYNVFANLDELVFLVNLRTLERLGSELAAVPMPKDDAERALMDYADCYIRFVEGNRALWEAVFQMRQVEVDTELREQVRARIAGLFHFIERALAPLVPDEERRKLSARSLWAAVHGILSLSGGVAPALTGIDDVPTTIHHLVRCHLAGLSSGAVT